MKTLFTRLAILLSIFVIGCSQQNADDKAWPGAKKHHFATIGTGGITGVYYPAGGAIARIVNAKRDVYGLRCTVESTGGSVFNVNAVLSGDLEFGVVQSDRQHQAFHGQKEWQEAGPQKNLRSVFSLHPEAVTLLAAVDAGIETFADLRGKRVNIGNPGSGQRENAIDALLASGIDYTKDILAESVKAAEAPGLLQDDRLDAFFYTVGHPSGAFKEATSGRRKTRFITIPNTDDLVRQFPYYAKTHIPLSFYPGAANTTATQTFGVMATLVTSVSVPDDVVYAITKEVFEHFEEFKALHPAFAMLTREGMLDGLSAPIHPGAMRYYREAGLTP